MPTITPKLRRNSPKMEERRQRILDMARSIIVERGVEGLNMRALADAADVAVRTIYGLIGAKEDILVALYVSFQTIYMDRIEHAQDLDPLQRIEAVVTQAVDMVAEDEHCYRAAYLVIEHLDDVKPPNADVARIFQNSELVVVNSFRTAVADGLLNGTIPSQDLAVLMAQSFRVLWRKWASGRISLDELRRDALINLRIILTADAVPSLRASLWARPAIDPRLFEG